MYVEKYIVEAFRRRDAYNFWAAKILKVNTKAAKDCTGRGKLTRAIGLWQPGR